MCISTSYISSKYRAVFVVFQVLCEREFAGAKDSYKMLTKIKPNTRSDRDRAMDEAARQVKRSPVIGSVSG